MVEAEAKVVIYGILSVLWQSLYVIDQNSWMRKRCNILVSVRLKMLWEWLSNEHV